MSPWLAEGRRALAAASVALVLVAPRAAADASPKRLAHAIDAVVARKEMAAALWGIEVCSLATGRTLYARNAGQAFRPASTMKLVTTAAALDALGADAPPVTLPPRIRGPWRRAASASPGASPRRANRCPPARASSPRTSRRGSLTSSGV